jgi:hypothetical protein
MTPTASRDLKIDALEKGALLERRRDSEAIHDAVPKCSRHLVSNPLASEFSFKF